MGGGPISGIFTAGICVGMPDGIPGGMLAVIPGEMVGAIEFGIKGV